VREQHVMCRELAPQSADAMVRAGCSLASAHRLVRLVTAAGPE
jgi:hypothetical protein